MTAFSQFGDTPYQITNEGREITLRFERTGPTTGRISWNIPPKSSGCSSDNPPAYHGILLTLDDTHTSIEKTPKDGQQYIPDPSGNPDQHMGDRIGSALVVGYIFDRETTFLDVTDLQSNKAYFVSGHAIDGVYRYHTAGVHSYSTEYGDSKGLDKPAKQNIRIGVDTIGVNPTDLTGLQIGEIYSLEMMLDNDERVTLSFLGDDVQTYTDLIDEWNKQAKLHGNPLQSPVIPNTGMFFYKTGEPIINQWNGTSYDEFHVTVDSDDPTIRNIDDLWYSPSNSQLRRWDGTTWVPEIVTNYHKPLNEVECNDYWFEGQEMYQWNGTIWEPLLEIESGDDPSVRQPLACNTHWFDENDDTLYKLDKKCTKWVQTLAQVWDTNPTQPSLNDYWINEDNFQLNQWDGSAWQPLSVSTSTSEPTNPNANDYWYHNGFMELYQWDGNVWIELDVFVWHIDPTTPVAGTLWWNTATDELNQWSEVSSQWKLVQPFIISSIDPLAQPILDIGTIWVDSGTYKRWDGSEWVIIRVLEYPTDPTNANFNNVVWFDNTVGHYKRFNGAMWVDVEVFRSDDDPFNPMSGDFWFNGTSSTLSRYDGTTWINTPYSTTSLKPSIGFKYYDTSLNELRQWNGYGWVDGDPKYTVRLINDNKFIQLESSMKGSYARVDVGTDEPLQRMFMDMEPSAQPYEARRGSDGLTETPSYAELGVGTDGSEDERRELIDSIRHQLGYPTVEVELTKQQFNYAVDAAIESLRKRSGMAYKRGFYFLDIEPRRQRYQLTDKRNGMNKIVDVSKIHRITSAFLSNAEGQGVYGQLALQHLYQMGTFDLISYHLVSQYIETMEHLFASQITFSWNEDNRTLQIFKDLRRKERVLMEVMVERTEQQILKDRYLKSWIEKYAAVECKKMLAQIRGKYSTLPGAGGGVALNAGELQAQADAELIDLYEQIDDFIANNPEEYGVGSSFIIG